MSGGAIQFVTAKPTTEDSGAISVDYGSFRTRRVEAAVSGPLLDWVQGRIFF
jgi:iron complex outermembrane receptor protein